MAAQQGILPMPSADKLATGYGSQVIPSTFEGPTPGKFTPAFSTAIERMKIGAALRMGIPSIKYTSGTDGHSANHVGHAADIDFASTLAEIGDTPENRAKLVEIAAQSGMKGLGTYAGQSSPFPDMFHVDVTPRRQEVQTWNRSPVSDGRYEPQIAGILNDYRGTNTAPIDYSLPVAGGTAAPFADTLIADAAPRTTAPQMNPAATIAHSVSAPPTVTAPSLGDMLKGKGTDEQYGLLADALQPEQEPEAPMMQYQPRQGYTAKPDNTAYWRNRWLQKFGPTSGLYAMLSGGGSGASLTQAEQAELAQYKASA